MNGAIVRPELQVDRNHASTGADQLKIVPRELGFAQRFRECETNGSKRGPARVALGDVAAHDRGGERVGDQVNHDCVRQSRVAAGVGRSDLDGHRIGIDGDVRRDGCEVERERNVVAHDFAIDEQLDIANLHVVSGRYRNQDRRPFECLDSVRCGIQIDRAGRDRHSGCDSLVIERAVIDDLQARRAIGHVSNTGTNGDTLRGRWQIELREETVGVRRVRNIQYMDHVSDADNATTSYGQPRTIYGNGRRGDVCRIDFADDTEIVEIEDIRG